MPNCSYNYHFLYFADFSAKHSNSWILETQFAHEESDMTTHLEGAQSVTMNPENGDIAVTDWFTRTVKVYNSTGYLQASLGVSEWSVADKRSRPRDVAISSNGSIFISKESPHIEVFDSNFTFSHTLESSHLAAEHSRLSGIVFHRNNLLVGECRHKSISIHSEDGRRLHTFRIDVTPRYLAMTPHATIVVSSWEPHRVDIINLIGVVVHTLKPPTGVTKWRPTGVSCSDDFIFVGNDDTSAPDEYGIYCYSFDGKYLGIATKDVVNPSGVAVTNDGSKLVVAQWERGNPKEKLGVHGVKIFTKKTL